jgi:2,3-bisphosphoglycerate-independent phosphoglycerate mutase
VKYVALILDGAAGLPLAELGGRTTLAAARTPNLDRMAREGTVGLARTVPEGHEPSSNTACTSILGYDPVVYDMGRGAIEAASLGIEMGPDDVAFRCNLVHVEDGIMADYSTGHIENGDSHRLIPALDAALGGTAVRFFAGLAYRHILRLTGAPETLNATCTPPHDIIGKPITSHMPTGPGSDVLLDLMDRARPVLAAHPVNAERVARGEPPATDIWLFWGGTKPGAVPSFSEEHGLRAAITSAVDLLGGLAEIFSIDRLEIAGVTDGPDNDYAAQSEGALAALADHDLVILHVESPDETGHSGRAAAKVKAIEDIDRQVARRLMECARAGGIRILAMPDHPTPIAIRTHSSDPVPFAMWGDGVGSNGAGAFDEASAQATGLVVEEGWRLMEQLTS